MKTKILLMAMALGLAGCTTVGSTLVNHPCSQAAIADLIVTAEKLKQCAANTLIETPIPVPTTSPE